MVTLDAAALTITGSLDFQSVQVFGFVISSHMKCATLAMFVLPGANRLERQQTATVAALAGCSTSTTERLGLPPLETVPHVDLGADYDYAAVGHPGRDYLWILSRAPTMPGATYGGILARLQAQGYDTSRLRRTLH